MAGVPGCDRCEWPEAVLVFFFFHLLGEMVTKDSPGLFKKNKEQKTHAVGSHLLPLSSRLFHSPCTDGARPLPALSRDGGTPLLFPCGAWEVEVPQAGATWAAAAGAIPRPAGGGRFLQPCRRSCPGPGRWLLTPGGKMEAAGGDRWTPPGRAVSAGGEGKGLRRPVRSVPAAGSGAGCGLGWQGRVGAGFGRWGLETSSTGCCLRWPRGEGGGGGGGDRLSEWMGGSGGGSPAQWLLGW